MVALTEFGGQSRTILTRRHSFNSHLHLYAVLQHSLRLRKMHMEGEQGYTMLQYLLDHTNNGCHDTHDMLVNYSLVSSVEPHVGNQLLGWKGSHKSARVTILPGSLTNRHRSHPSENASCVVPAWYLRGNREIWR